MGEQSAQTYKNHSRIDPLFHYFVLPVAAISLGMAVMRLIRNFSLDNCWLLILSLAFVVAALKIRMYPLQAQDRVIRLEERLRLERVLSEPLRTESRGLTERQLVALRFAPDSELTGLVQQALTNRWNGKQIKGAVQTWRPDHFRV